MIMHHQICTLGNSENEHCKMSRVTATSYFHSYVQNKTYSN